MNKFFKALTTKDTFTENGMPTHSSSGSFVVDFFYKMGGVRSGRESMQSFIGLFYAALGENPNLTLKAVFNLRDPRGGMGERDVQKILLNSLAHSHPEWVRKLVQYIPEFGRWDDILVLLDTPVEKETLKYIWKSLMEKDQLCAKWMPRENKAQGYIAKYLMRKFDLRPVDYRHLLSQNSKTVENLMCRGDWENIKFSSVPALAMKLYRNAFKKHQEERFAKYLESVEKGEEKINTGVLTPVSIVHEYLTKYGYDKALELLWTNLPDTVPDHLSFIPLCDLSGSMFMGTGIPAEVSVSLGIYLSQRNKSIFQNGFITFSHAPSFVFLTGKTLWDNIQIMRKINMAQNTDLKRAFDLILSKAVAAQLLPEEMPTNLMIISDMQFDSCTGNPNASVLEMIDHKYEKAGYKRPGIFFWNVASAEGVPVKVDDKGVALVSGFSPNLLRNVLSGEISPLAQVKAILNNGLYDFVNEIVPPSE